jgi:hypothetical protein
VFLGVVIDLSFETIPQIEEDRLQSNTVPVPSTGLVRDGDN